MGEAPRALSRALHGRHTGLSTPRPVTVTLPSPARPPQLLARDSREPLPARLLPSALGGGRQTGQGRLPPRCRASSGSATAPADPQVGAGLLALLRALIRHGRGVAVTAATAERAAAAAWGRGHARRGARGLPLLSRVLRATAGPPAAGTRLAAEQGPETESAASPGGFPGCLLALARWYRTDLLSASCSSVLPAWALSVVKQAGSSRWFGWFGWFGCKQRQDKRKLPHVEPVED